MSKEEIWKNAIGFEGYYQASSLGRIRKIRFDIKGNISSHRILSTKSQSVTLRAPKLAKTFNTSSLIYNTFFPDKKGQNFSYKDGNKFNREIDNFIHKNTSRNDSPFSEKCLKDLKNENWKHIPDFEGYYQISSEGRIRKIRVNIDRSLEILRMLKPHKIANRQITIQLSKNGKITVFVLASLLHDTFNPDKKGQKYKFKDGDPLNTTLDNLISLKGKRRMDSDTRKKVESSIKSGESLAEISRNVGLSRERIRQIKNEIA